LPKDLIVPTIRWYHQVTGYPGSKRLYQHIHQQYYNRDLCRLVDNFKCNYCQRNKLDGKGYGLLPEQEAGSIPFEECAMDLIRLWTVQVRGNPYKFEALTVIDTVTNLVELIRIDDKRSKTVARKFAQCWLTHYPWPQRCVYDPGTKFTGPEFQALLQNCHIRDVCTTAKNPQSNAVGERMHQTMGNVLRTLYGNPPHSIANAAQYVDKALSIAMHAMGAGVHSTLGSSPDNLVFNRDMFLNILLNVDWHAITQRREHLIKLILSMRTS
jgi:transposase InsO family protein